MRCRIFPSLAWTGIVLALLPQSGLAQADRDYVFDDEQGHLVIRFAGTGGRGIDSAQAEEILNSELSSMVHDRLRADLLFEHEPRDPQFAGIMEPQIEAHVRHAGPEFPGILTECRAASCRVVMEQRGLFDIPQHQAVLEEVQRSLEAFIAARPQQFERIFMITAYYKDAETPHIKAFLRRAGHGSDSPAGG